MHTLRTLRPILGLQGRGRRTFSTRQSIVLWHNPNCSKSRAALAILEEDGRPFEVREYQKECPTFSELETLQRQLKAPPIEWARTSDEAWIQHFDGITIFDDILPDDGDIMRAMVQFPIMIERPILVVGEKAVVGRPIDRIFELLSHDELKAKTKSADTERVQFALKKVATAVTAASDRGVPVDLIESTLLKTISELECS